MTIVHHDTRDDAARVIGFGVSFKARDPQVLAAWYAQPLRMKIKDFGGAMFGEDAARPRHIVWSPFREPSANK